MVSDLASDDAVFTCDVGEPTVWAARYLKMNGRRRLVGSFLHGSMANAMPQAIGAQMAFPGRQVISMSGDGGFGMLMGDLLTVRQHKLPVKIVIFNNGLLGFVDIEMKAGGFLPTGTRLDNPDFAKMAESMGIYGVRIEDPQQMEAALSGHAARHQARKEPHVVQAQRSGGVLAPYKIVFSNPQSYLCGLAAGLLFVPTTVGDMVWGVRFFQADKSFSFHDAVFAISMVPLGWVFKRRPATG